MPETKTRMTAEELIAMPDNGMRRELVRGELREMAPAGALHGDAAMNIGALLKNHVKANGLGRVPAAETGFIIARNPDTTRAPDTGFISEERIPKEGPPDGYWELAPDLAVEVIEEDTAEYAQSKIESWIEAGVRLVWVVYPKTRSIVVHKSLKDISTLTEEETHRGRNLERRRRGSGLRVCGEGNLRVRRLRRARASRSSAFQPASLSAFIAERRHFRNEKTVLVPRRFPHLIRAVRRKS